MNIMVQSTKAHDRSLGESFHDIQRASVKLPRFQRMEASDRHRITSFLDTVIKIRPMGGVLILKVDGNESEKFVSRARAVEYLLAGQHSDLYALRKETTEAAS